MTVKEYFEVEKITKEWLFKNIQGFNSYGDKSVAFVVQVWERSLDALSQKQMQWLDDILEDCIEKRIDGK